jgi:hypothetical protein
MVAHEEAEFAGVAFAIVGRHEVLVHEGFGAFLREEVVRHFVDQDFFGGTEGLVLLAESLEEGLHFFVGLLFQEREVGAEAVAQGVLSGSDFPGVGARAR